MIEAIKNPTEKQIVTMIEASKHKAARRIVTSDGDAWYWPAEQGTHREGADFLGIEYDRPPGAGDIVTL